MAKVSGKSWFGRAGQVNLRGKKSKVLSCRCCCVRNIRDRFLSRIALREMRQK